MKKNNITFLHHILVLVSCLLLASCSDDMSDDDIETPVVLTGSGETSDNPFKTSAEPCGLNQIAATLGDQYYPGPKCSHIARNLDSERFSQKNILLCQEKSQATSPPASAARVQITKCGPALTKEGIIYSKLICCDISEVTPKKKSTPPKSKMFTYDAALNCPKNNLQAFATNLHWPRKRCSQIVATFQGGPQESGHYHKACQGGGKK